VLPSALEALFDCHLKLRHVGKGTNHYVRFGRESTLTKNQAAYILAHCHIDAKVVFTLRLMPSVVVTGLPAQHKPKDLMHRIFTGLGLALALSASSVFAQDLEYLLTVPPSDDYFAGYTVGIHSGARDVSGPHDLDGDGQYEVLVSDYTGGGRVHVVENRGPDTWELVWSTPALDSTATTNNIRAISAGDLDGDGNGEIYFLGGRNYSETNPNIDNLPPGLYAFEYTGEDDNYGDLPASIYEFGDHLPNRWRAEQIVVQDVDGDGFDELMFANNASDNPDDNWYVISVTGDIGSGFEAWVEELRLSSRVDDFDPASRGGGSPYGMVAADFDGDGSYEISMHSWNYYNFTNADVTGPDTYVAPDSNASNVFLQATFPDDHVAFFGCAVADVDGNGDDEVFCPNLTTAAVSVINYEEGEDPLEITADNVAVGVIPSLTALGIGTGDLDQDGLVEIYGSGPSYTGSSFAAGNPPNFVRVAEFLGGDPEDPANYAAETLPVDAAFDMMAFDEIRRDSAGVTETYYESGVQGPEFVSKFAYLGDADMDGNNELAIGFQGVDDSTYVIDEVWSDQDTAYVRTVVSATVNENRTFMRVVSGSGVKVSIEDERIILPNDYRLSANYPNPFNPSTAFSFTLPLDKRVSVKVFDVSGRLVTTLIDNELRSEGVHQVTWNGTNAAGAAVASGTYLYTLEYGNFRQTRSMVLLK
jgi:hypothetical protein